MNDIIEDSIMKSINEVDMSIDTIESYIRDELIHDNRARCPELSDYYIELIERYASCLRCKYGLWSDLEHHISK